jgi:hypothetical protein
MATFIKCKNCGEEFEQTSKGKVYCGNRKNKTGCSFLVHKNYYKTPRFAELKKIYSQKPASKYCSYRALAKIRNIKFDITYDEFSTFWQQPCSYCGGEIKTVGLDRVDSNKGYFIDNVVSCCITCNKMKMALSSNDFINHIKKILEHIQ